MDEDVKTWIAVFIIAMIIIFAVAYSYSSSQVIAFNQIELYADVGMRISIENNIWWRIDLADFNYSKIVYVHNPNDYEVKLDISWETVPNELREYASFSPLILPNVTAKGTLEVTMYFMIRPNNLLRLNTDNNVLTQIKGVDPNV